MNERGPFLFVILSSLLRSVSISYLLRAKSGFGGAATAAVWFYVYPNPCGLSRVLAFLAEEMLYSRFQAVAQVGK